MSSFRNAAPLAALFMALLAPQANAQEAVSADTTTSTTGGKTGDAASTTDQIFAVHAQSTFTVQATPGFSAPYAGANSLGSNQAQETFDATLYVGVRPWHGAEIWINPEIDQGFGLSNTLGLAGFSSGEAYKVGKATPYLKLPRMFLRQTISLGGEASNTEAAANQLQQHQSTDRLVFTIGKFGAVDVFDTNLYAHDPRADFLNWSVIDTGSFDYAANAWGYSYGGTAEWYQRAWVLRAGLFNLSQIPNSPQLESNFSQYQMIGEVEHDHHIAGHAGAIRGGFYFSRGRFALLSDAIALYNTTGNIPADLSSLRRFRDKWGVYVTAEQEVLSMVGLFARAGTSDGASEADEFSDIDRTISLGTQIKGGVWGRAQDRIGIAGVVNAISKLRQQFLADGGMGILVGDGRLPHPGDEMIAESWYSLPLRHDVTLTADYQFVVNPAYNRDRGPVHIAGLRLHIAD